MNPDEITSSPIHPLTLAQRLRRQQREINLLMNDVDDARRTRDAAQDNFDDTIEEYDCVRMQRNTVLGNLTADCVNAVYDVLQSAGFTSDEINAQHATLKGWTVPMRNWIDKVAQPQ